MSIKSLPSYQQHGQAGDYTFLFEGEGKEVKATVTRGDDAYVLTGRASQVLETRMCNEPCSDKLEAICCEYFNAAARSVEKEKLKNAR